jgi:hypothetical protein
LNQTIVSGKAPWIGKANDAEMTAVLRAADGRDPRLKSPG